VSDAITLGDLIAAAAALGAAITFLLGLAYLAGTFTTELGAVQDEIGKLAALVSAQNGRVGKLERFRAGVEAAERVRARIHGEALNPEGDG